MPKEKIFSTITRLARTIQGRIGGKMPKEKIFPTVLMILDFFAAVPYAMNHDLRMTVYWIAAGVLTLSVTWL